MPKWTLQIARFGWNSSERPIAFAERSKSEPGRTGRARGALVEPSVPFDRFDLADELALRMHVWWASALPAALSGSLHEDIFFWLIGSFRNTNRPLRVASSFGLWRKPTIRSLRPADLSGTASGILLPGRCFPGTTSQLAAGDQPPSPTPVRDV